MFDAHVHILDPRFPLVENNGLIPDHYTIADYQSDTAGLGITGGAVVNSSFQGTDQRFLIAAIKELGADWVGVTQLDSSASDKEILRLDKAGVRGVRFNLRRGRVDIEQMTHLARRAYDLANWHCEMYVDGSMLASLEPVIAKLPALSIDHLGMSQDAQPYLLNLVDRGARVKASGFGRIELEIVDALRDIHRVNPESLMFGSDLPALRSERRFERADIDLIREAVGGDAHLVLENNARAFYRLKPRPTPKPPKTKPLNIIELVEVDDQTNSDS